MRKRTIVLMALWALVSAGCSEEQAAEDDAAGIEPDGSSIQFFDGGQGSDGHADSGGGGDTDSGPLEPPAAPGTSGSRLRRVLWEAEGVQVAKLEHYDTLLGTRCAWNVVADGTVRCVPLSHHRKSSSALPTLGSNRYADASCTQHLELIPADTADALEQCGVQPLFAEWRELIDTVACTPLTEIFNHRGTVRLTRLTQRHPSGAGVYWFPSAGAACEPGPADQDWAHYSFEEIALSALVEGSLSEGPAGARLRLMEVTTADGLQVQGLLYDLQRDELCLLPTDGGPQGRCLPVTGLATQSHYRPDAQCAGDPVAIYYKQACAAPKYVVPQAYGACGLDGHPLKTLSSQLAQAYHQVSDGTCSALDLEEHDVFSVGAEVDVAGFAPGVVEGYGNAGRIQPLVQRADGLTLFRPAFWDSTLQQVCTPAGAVDGQLRCLPEVPTVVQRYLDAACAEPVLQSPCDQLGPLVRVAVSDSGGCGPQRHRVVELGAELTSPPQTIYVLGKSGCSPINAPSGGLYQPGAERSATDFVPVSEVVE